MTNARAAGLSALLDRFASKRALVLGDVVADEYIVGRPTRISREAPVLILQHTDTFLRPGGGTNTAYNVAALGGSAVMVGLVGDDERGIALRALLEEAGIATDGLVVDSTRPTPAKTRILARGPQEVSQQIVRVDRVDESPITGRAVEAMVGAVGRHLEQADCVIVSDYDQGVVSVEVIAACIPRARELGIPIIVDSHGDLTRFHKVTAATPNQPEVEAAAGRALERDEDLDVQAERLRQEMDSDALLVTRGSLGLVLYERSRAPYRLPVALGDAPVLDPTGAGDTVAAVFALALSSGADMRTAAFLGNVAGGEAVRRLGPSAITCAELLAAAGRTTLPLPRSTAADQPV